MLLPGLHLDSLDLFASVSGNREFRPQSGENEKDRIKVVGWERRKSGILLEKAVWRDFRVLEWESFIRSQTHFTDCGWDRWEVVTRVARNHFPSGHRIKTDAMAAKKKRKKLEIS